MYRFLRSPKWLAGHVLALTGLVVFVAAGFWQLDRLEQRRSYNETFTSRLEEPVRPLEEVLTDVGPDPEALAYRRVTASGRYLAEEEILLSPRSYQGRPGHHVLTPLQVGEGTGVVVDRGWVPLELDTAPVAEAAPGSEEVTVTGVLFPPEPGGRAREVAGGEVDLLTALDIDRYQPQVPLDLAPVYLLAQEQTPAPAQPLPLAAELPELSEGNHLSYAVQWFVFAGVVVVGYPLLIRRTARDRTGPPTPRPRQQVPAGLPR